MQKDDDSKISNREFFSRILFAIIIVIITPFGVYEAFHADFQDERFKVFVIFVALGIEGSHLHIIANAFLHKKEVAQKAKEAHSIGCHFCNADAKHCFRFRNKPMPICSRHLGFYGGLLVLLITVLLIPDGWFTFVTYLPWNIHLAIFIILLIAVATEGGLGKAKIIKANNPVRVIGGILSALGVAFFAMFIITLFGLLGATPVSDISALMPPAMPSDIVGNSLSTH